MEETYHKLATDGHEYSDIRKESKEVGGKNKFSEIFGNEMFAIVGDKHNPTIQLIADIELIRKSKTQFIDKLSGDNKPVAQKTMRMIYRRILNAIDSRSGMTIVKAFEEGVPDDMEKAKTIILKYLQQAGDPWYQHFVRDNINEKVIWWETFAETRLPAIKTKFIDLATKMIENGTLPISKEHLTSRLENAVIGPSDVLTDNTTTTWGSYDQAHHRVFINIDYLREAKNESEIETLVFHELIHAIAGETLVTKSTNDKLVQGDLRIMRGGVEFEITDKVQDKEVGEKLKKNDKYLGRFRWLNEAITETEAIKMSAFDKSTSYLNERKIFELLMTQGDEPIPRQLFINAYYENFDPSKNPPNPAWRELTDAIEVAYEPGYLLKLDKFIKKMGVVKALEVIKNKGDLDLISSTKISVDSEEYKKAAEETKKEEGKNPYEAIFGAELFNIGKDETSQTLIKINASKLRIAKHKKDTLKLLDDYEIVNMFTLSLVANFSEDKKLETQVNKVMAGKATSKETENAFNMVRDYLTNLSEIEYVKLIESYVKQIVGDYQEILSKVEVVKNKAIELIKQRVIRKEIPVTLEYLEQKVNNLNVKMGDIITKQLIMGAEASYWQNQNVIFVDMTTVDNEDELIDTLVHEFTHMISGQTPHQVIDKKSKERSVRSPKIGLAFDITKKVNKQEGLTDEESGSSFRFGWLNEAMTQLETEATMVNKKTTKFYQDEITLLKLLESSGHEPIPRQLFINAYYENFDPSKNPPNPAWKELIAKITEAYDPTFLLRLDKFARKNGVDEAIKNMREKPLSV